MSDTDLRSRTSEFAPDTAQPGLSAGQMLKAAREAQGLHVAALAVSLKVPVRKIEALESDELAASQDPVFVRALAGSVCRALKIDAAPILAKLPSSGPVKLAKADPGINRSYNTPSLNTTLKPWGLLSRPAVLAAIALVVGAAVLMALPSFQIRLASEQAAAQTSTPVVASAPPAAGGETVIGAPALQATPVLAAASASAPAPAASAALVAASAASPSAPVSSSLSYSANAPDVNLVVVQALSEVWVGARNAKGSELAGRTLAAGETVGFSGPVPVRVVVGRADAIKVWVRGQSFDTAPHTKDNITKFEVK